MKKIELSKGMVALVDDEDFEEISKTRWYLTASGKYAVSIKHIYLSKYNYSRERLLMHRLLLNPSCMEEVDHINGDGLDNRRCNLRLCSSSQNAANRRTSINNTSGYKGVYWHKNRKLWRARITFHYKPIHIGTFKSKISAAKAYNEKAVELFGEFALLNKI